MYEGPLPTKKRGVSPVKAHLRDAFSPQIEEQLKSRVETFEYLSSRLGEHEFVCVVNDRLRTGAELDILLLTPTSIARPGDLDNRLKTLVDGLTRPANVQQLTPSASTTSQTFCLLEDDGLVTRLTVDSRPWLGRPKGSADILAVVNVKRRQQWCADVRWHCARRLSRIEGVDQPVYWPRVGSASRAPGVPPINRTNSDMHSVRADVTG